MAGVRAHFDGKVFVPDEPPRLAPGTRVSVIVDAEAPLIPATADAKAIGPVIVGLDPETSHAIAHDPELASENI